MRLLFDTHAMLWWIGGDDRFLKSVREIVFDPATEVLISTVSYWEATIKTGIGKLSFDIDHLEAERIYNAFGLLDLSTAHIRRLTVLPMHHRDPFDHLLIAQAIEEDAAIVTADAAFSAYPVRLIGCG